MYIYNYIFVASIWPFSQILSHVLQQLGFVYLLILSSSLTNSYLTNWSILEEAI